MTTRRKFLAGLCGLGAAVLSPQASGAAIGRLRFGRPTSSSLGPSGKWNGTGGSGYGAPYLDAPVDPTRTTAKPAGLLLNVPRTPFTADTILVVNAHAAVIAGFGGVQQVNFYCEGTKRSIYTPTATVREDANGADKTWFGHSVVLDWDVPISLTTTGELVCYMEIIPNNGALQTRVLGPFSFYPRNTGVGSGCEFDKKIICDKDGIDIAGTQYNTLVKCLNYFTTGGAGAAFQFPNIEIIRNGDHTFQTAVSSESLARARFTVITAADGIVANVGDGSANRPAAGLQYDGVCFRGAGILIDLAKISPNLTGFRLRTSSNKLLWFDGCELYCGDNDYLLGSGSGMGALYDEVTSSGYWVSAQSGLTSGLYFTDVDAHDLPGYGLGFCALVRCCVLDGVGGSAHENVYGGVFGGTTSRIGGILSGLRTYQDCMTLAYTGAGTGTVTVSGNSGASSRTLTLLVNGVSVHTMAITGTAPTPPSSTPNTTKVAAVVSNINAYGTGWAAVEITQAEPRAACFLTLESYGNASPIGISPNTPPPVINATPKTFATWIDVHADGLVWHDGTFENVVVDRLDLEELVSCTMIGLNSNATLKDFYVGHVTSQDTSADYGEGASGGYISSASASHLVLEYISQAAGQQNMTTTFTPDAYCSFRQCALETLQWSTRGSGIYPSLAIEGLSIIYTASGLPVGSNATSKVQPFGYTDANLFTDPATPNFIPLSPLLLTDDSYSGALLPGGGYNGV